MSLSRRQFAKKLLAAAGVLPFCGSLLAEKKRVVVGYEITTEMMEFRGASRTITLYAPPPVEGDIRSYYTGKSHDGFLYSRYVIFHNGEWREYTFF